MTKGKVLVGCALCALQVMAAEDRTVEAGESVTLTESADYGRLVVNGSLTVASRVRLTCEQLCVGTGAVDNASLVLQNCATVSVTKASQGNGFDCVIGVEGSTGASLTLADGAFMDVNGTLGLAHGQTLVTQGNIVLDGASLLKVKTGLFINRGGTWANVDSAVPYATIALNGTSRLEIGGSITKNNNTTTAFRFNGGELCGTGKGALVNDNQKGKVIFESVDGQDIRLRRTSDFTAMIAEGGNRASFEAQGEGALVKLGAGRGSLASATGSGFLAFALNQLGGIRVEEGGFVLDATSAAAIPATRPMTVFPGALLDLNGHSLLLHTLVASGAGSLLNTSEALSTLTVGGGNGDVRIESVAGNVALVKEGSGTLELVSGTAESVSVTAGAAVFGNRREIGFPYYKWHVTAAQYGRQNNVRASEVYFYSGDDDITAASVVFCFQDTTGENAGDVNYGGARPEHLLDRDLQTLWDDRRLARHEGKLANLCWVAFRCRSSVPLTSYTFATGDKIEVFPSAWTFCGSADGENWTVLDTRTNVVATTVNAQLTERFPVADPSVRETLTVGRVAVASEAKLTVAGATLVCSSFDASAGEIRLVDGGTVEAGDGAVYYPNLTGDGCLAKVGSGERTVYGSGAFAGLVDVREGVLRFTDCGAEGPWFRFSILANRTNGTASVQLSELALYDAQGRRLNQGLAFNETNKAAPSLAAGELTTICKASRESEGPDKMTDGDLSTKAGLYTTEKPNVITMRLAEDAGRVVSYALATGNDHSERDPGAWTLEASANGTDWVRLDMRTDVEVGEARSTYAAYNGGKPFFTTNVCGGAVAFAPSATVKVSGDAVLDLSDTETVIGNLMVDYASGGTIRKFRPGVSGTLTVSNVPSPWRELTLPVRLEDVGDSGNLADWSVIVNGRRLRRATLTVRDGALVIVKPGLAIVIR